MAPTLRRLGGNARRVEASIRCEPVAQAGSRSWSSPRERGWRFAIQRDSEFGRPDKAWQAEAPAPPGRQGSRGIG